MSDVVIFDPENREIRAVWRTFKSRVARLLSYDPAVDVRRSVRPGQTLFRVTWADGSTDEVTAPSACSGVVKTVRYKKGPYSELSLRPSAVLIELVDAADRGSRGLEREPCSDEPGGADPRAGMGPGAEDDDRPPEPRKRGKPSLEKGHRKGKERAPGLYPPAAAARAKGKARTKRKPPAKKRAPKKEEKT